MLNANPRNLRTFDSSNTPDVCQVEEASATFVRPRVWTVWLAFVVSLVEILVAQILVTLGIAAHLVSRGNSFQELRPLIVDSISTPKTFILLIFLGPSMFGVVALAAAWMSPAPWRDRIAWRPASLYGTNYSMIALGSLFPAIIAMGLAEFLCNYIPQIPVDKLSTKVFDQMTPIWFGLFVLTVGLVPGFCEEIMFRGLMQRRFIERWGAMVGIIVTSIVFGLAHIMPLSIMLATIIGLYMGVVSWKVNSIWPTIACHVFINSSINLWRMVVKFGEPPSTVQYLIVTLVLLVSAICCAMTLHRLFASRTASISDGKIDYQADTARDRIT